MSELAGGLCAILGVVLLIGGFAAYFYEERTWGGLWITYPYRDLAIPLMILGVVLIIGGAFLYSYASRARAWIPHLALPLSSNTTFKMLRKTVYPFPFN